MPERIFFGKNLTQLKAILESLQSNLGTGGIEELQVSGIRTRTKAISPEERRDLIADVRLEGWRVAYALDDTDENKAASLLAWPDPRREKVMRVESRYGWPSCPSTLP